jgi:hypothetical protein
MQKHLDFVTKTRYAKRLSDMALEFAIRDCRRRIALGVDPDFYRDEISVYMMEQAARIKRMNKVYLRSLRAYLERLAAI